MSSQKVVFDQYRTAVQVIRQFSENQRGSAYASFGTSMALIAKTTIKPIDFFEGVRQTFFSGLSRGQPVDRVTIASYRQMMEEYRWYRLNQPRYRVYPNMVAALSRVSIDIDAVHLRLPFATFAIELPKDYFRESETSPYLKGMLVHCRRRDSHAADHDSFDYGVRYTRGGEHKVVEGDQSPDSNDVMIVDLDFGDEVITSRLSGQPEMNACKPFAVFDVDAGKTISERFDAMPETPLTDDGYMPSTEFQKACLRIAVGIAFFAVNDHEVIERVIPEGYRERRERAIKTGNKKLLQKVSNEIKNTGNANTFVVGRELVINEHPDDAARQECASGARQLHWGHVQGAHLRWQPHGPREAPDYKLIFVAPMLIRPDLPMRPGAPHALR